MKVLVDTSTWIDYFRGNAGADAVDILIEENVITTNQLILAEIVPSLYVHNQKQWIAPLREIKQYPVAVDWDALVLMQIKCLKNGINKIGIPDLIIAQHTMQHNLHLLSADKHFALMAKIMPLLIYKK